MAREGELLWEPPEELLTGSKMARYMRVARLLGLPRAVALVGRGPRGLLALDLGAVRGAGRAARARARRAREMPGAEWFPGTQLNYAEHALPRRGGAGTAIVHASESRPLAELSWDELGDAGGALRGRAAAAGRGARRPRGRLHAERGRDGRRVPGHGEPRRDLVELRAGVRHADGGRPLRADRAEGADRDRGLPLRRARLRPARARARDRGGLPTLEHTRDGAVATGTTLLRRAGAPLDRSSSVPFDHPLWVLFSSGTTGLPKAIVQGHGGILLEHLKKLNLHSDLGAGRPLLLVHDDRLDDVELPGRRAAGRARRSCSTTASPTPEGLWEFAAEARCHVLRHERGVHRRVHEGGRRAAGAAGAAQRRVDRLAAAGRGVRVGLRELGGRVAVLDQRRHRPVHGVRRRVPAAAGAGRASCRRARWARRSRRGTRTAGR